MADLTPEQIERLRVVLADSVCDYRRQSRRVPLCVACDARHVAPVVAAMLAEARADERNRIASEIKSEARTYKGRGRPYNFIVRGNWCDFAARIARGES